MAAQSVSRGSVGVAQVHVFSLVREQTVDLGAWNFGGFTGAILIEPDLIVGRATAYLRQVDWASGTGVSLLLSTTDTGQPHTAGPEFIPDVEDYSLAFTFADSGGGSVVIGGPNDPDSSSLDPTEPYYWLPSNNFEWLTWYNNAANNGYDVTLTIRAVPVPVTAILNLSAFAASPFHHRTIGSRSPARSTSSCCGTRIATRILRRGRSSISISATSPHICFHRYT